MNEHITLSLGPFQGITDMPFRNIYKTHFRGIDKFYTPFFTGIQKDNARNLRTEEIDPHHNDVAILTPQLLSTDAEEVLRFARQCGEMGYHEINLNMGCPFPRVANKRRGSGMLPYPQRIDEMLEQVFEKITLKLSIKCRLGYYSPDEIIPVIEVFNKYPLSELIIHPRIGKQLYKGEADVSRFKTLASSIKAPLIYNGDIFTPNDFVRIASEVGDVSGFMLGRGLLADPFLPEKIKGLDTGDAMTRLRHYVDDLYEDRLRHAGGSPKVLGRMKELWSYLMLSFEESQQIWRNIKKLNALGDYEAAVDDIFRNYSLKTTRGALDASHITH